jgi:predicted DNA-binding transcriptional regulator YafY
MAKENTELIDIDYESERRQERVQYTVGPLQIFQAGELWRLLALHDGVIKQFIMTKILNVKINGEQFKRPEEQKIAEIFKHSFLIWTGEQTHTVRLRLAKSVARKLQSRQLISFKTITKNINGSIEVEGLVNSIEELATWITGQGGRVVALTPLALIEKVRVIAKLCYDTHR